MTGDFSVLARVCAQVGLCLSELGLDVQQRLRLLMEHGETVHDACRIVQLARAIFEHYARAKPDRAFDPLEQRIVLIGSLFADIGKTGPPGITLEEQRLIVEMFAVEGVRNEQQTVARFFVDQFPDDAAERTARFSALGLDVNMPMRSFWNLHAGWTLEVARQGGLPDEAVAAAAAHHLLEDVNPGDIVGPDGRYSAEFGENVAFDRAEKLVILLDKYDALLRRGRRTHDEAIAWLRRFVARHERFGDDPEFGVLIDDLDNVGRTAALN